MQVIEKMWVELGKSSLVKQKSTHRYVPIHDICDKLEPELPEVLLSNPECKWVKDTTAVMNKHDLNDQDLYGTKYYTKNLIQRAIHKGFKQRITESGQGKSKMEYFHVLKTEWKPGQRAKYMSELTRKQTTLIYRARTRMLKVKGNYKNGHSDLKCRMCVEGEETQTHILEQCPGIHKNEASKVPKHQIFTEDTDTLKQTAIKIENILTKIEESV